MALDIFITLNGKVPKWNEATSLSFDSESADYWYLWSTMLKEIKDQTGEMLDLYEDAELSGENLTKVERILLKQLKELKAMKEKQWEVHTGTEIIPIQREVYKTLIKKDLVGKLERFLVIVQLAIEKKEKVMCTGD